MDLFSLYILYVFANSEHVMASQRTVSCKCRPCTRIHVHICMVINEMSKGKFPDLGKQSIQAKKSLSSIFFFFFLACDTEM